MQNLLVAFWVHDFHETEFQVFLHDVVQRHPNPGIVITLGRPLRVKLAITR